MGRWNFWTYFENIFWMWWVIEFVRCGDLEFYFLHLLIKLFLLWVLASCLDLQIECQKLKRNFARVTVLQLQNATLWLLRKDFSNLARPVIVECKHRIDWTSNMANRSFVEVLGWIWLINPTSQMTHACQTIPITE